MKHACILKILLLLCSVYSPMSAQQDSFIKDYLERLENSRKYLILVVETMPEEKYSFKASVGSLTFAEHFMHIGFALDWHSQSLLGGRAARNWETDTLYKIANKSKQEMITIIDKTFDEAMELIEGFEVTEMDDTLDYFGLNRTKRQIFLLLADHITHHRSQMLVCLRMNGYLPPRYVLFQ